MTRQGSYYTYLDMVRHNGHFVQRRLSVEQHHIVVVHVSFHYVSDFQGRGHTATVGERERSGVETSTDLDFLQG